MTHVDAFNLNPIENQYNEEKDFIKVREDATRKGKKNENKAETRYDKRR